MARKAKENDDSITIEQEEILTQQLADAVESQIAVQDAHDDYYDSRSIIPADNVDADGVPWATVGENIRKGAKSISTETLEKLFSALLGKPARIEYLTCTITPNETLTVDNKIFTGRTIVISANNYDIAAFFVINSNITNGDTLLSLKPFANLSTTISVRSNVASAVSGTVSLCAVLV